jgi:uncharacterized protein YceK
MNKLLTIVLALQLAGCATVRTLDAAKPGAPVVYAGTRLDLYAMNGGCCAMDRFGAEAPSYPGWTCRRARCSIPCCCRCRC